MPNSLGTDVLLQAPNPREVADFYRDNLAFEVTELSPTLFELAGPNINLYIEEGPTLGPIFEITVNDIEATTQRLLKAGGIVVKDEPEFPRRYIQDPNDLIYNLSKVN